ncbi:MAG TPA: ArdC family protein, partial [Dermatophilaceae bacterium]|nr:ArdC family protein [Dermatophilaceae bacterium]HPZ69683.1 ArdC family protein [Dermatophilaceae bacterium]
WQSWLKFASSLHKYSMSNTLLIMLATGGQATAVAGYRAWQAKGRQVRAGEKAIRILARASANQ